ncbi:serine/threonine-protein phosphatase 4 regulatory subunit 2-B-like isoform X1 [Branchiostoma floridae]|uniref:Serine/threonine-protein phosphatase 4 regulatory subunit 2-B-like isoform X1 n=1 Tax=Branchiostoma floridae TaxID=7739 RepID=A0A9J7L577_BRAFL|nr:serine/threonine-protein phosphatase 4 regulatory subunit 2-B-like isoform X1 [Branchiostoma floridae]
MENGDSYLHALEDFEKRKELTPELEQYLRHIAKTGETIYPWNRLKPVFLLKLEKVMQEFNEEAPKVDGPPTPNVENLSYEEMRERVVSIIESFTGPPFTMQRLCELVTDPKKHYKRSDKFLRGVEKNVLVVSTVHGGASRRLSAGGDKLVNGIASQDGADSLSVAMPPPPCPAPHLSPIAAGASPLPPFPPPDHDHLETPSLGASPSVCNDISDTTSPSSPVTDHTTGTNGGESHNRSGETTVDKEDNSLQNSTYTEQLEDRSRIADDMGGEDSAPSDSSTSEDSSESSLSDDTPTSAPDCNPTETGSSAETTFSTEPCQSTEAASSSVEAMFPVEPTEALPCAESAEPRDTTEPAAASADSSTSPEDKGSEPEPCTRPTRACTRSAEVLEEDHEDSGSPRKIRRIEEAQPSDQSEQTTASHDQAANKPEPSSEPETPASQSEESSEEQKAEDVEEPMEQD